MARLSFSIKSAGNEVKKLLYIALTIVALLVVACQKPAPEAGAEGKKSIVATTTMIEDLARQLGGEDLKVAGIMKPGGDPHLYKPTPADATLIARSDLVLTNGLKLEGWIDDLVRNAGGKASVVEVTKGIDALKDPAKTNYPDPHVWHDVSKWIVVTRNVRDALSELDPAHAEAIKARADKVEAELKALDEKIKADALKVPEGQRVLVTSHDAFQYYGKRYGFEVIAVQGLSTESEAGVRDVARVVDIIRKRQIPAIFIESSVNPKLIEQISRETGVRIGGTLFSDSLGDPKGPGGTYTGMLSENTRQIVEALSKTPAIKNTPPEAARPDADKAN